METFEHIYSLTEEEGDANKMMTKKPKKKKPEEKKTKKIIILLKSMKMQYKYTKTTCIRERTEFYVKWIQPAFNEMVDKMGKKKRNKLKKF